MFGETKEEILAELASVGMHWADYQIKQGQTKPDPSEWFDEEIVEAWRDGYEGVQWPE